MNNACFFDKATYDKFVKEIPQSRLITPSSVSERMKIRVSLARAALNELVKQGNFPLLNISFSRNSSSGFLSSCATNLCTSFENLNLCLYRSIKYLDCGLVLRLFIRFQWFNWNCL